MNAPTHRNEARLVFGFSRKRRVCGELACYAKSAHVEGEAQGDFVVYSGFNHEMESDLVSSSRDILILRSAHNHMILK